jgi:polar amino acid transport system substrate-binding protein
MRRLLLILAMLPGVALPRPVAPAAAPADEAPRTLVLCFEDSDVLPWRTREKVGLNFTMLDAVAARTGLRFDYQGRPWRRCHDDLRAGRVDGTFGMSVTPERQAFAAFPGGDTPDPSLRMFEGGYVLVRRRGTTVDFDGERIIGLDGAIGAEPATSIAQDLRRKGYAVDDAAPSPQALLRKLAAGRIAAAAVGTDQMHQLSQEAHPWLRQLEEVPRPLVEKPYFLALSKPFVARHPDLAARVWQAVAEVRESPAYQADVARVRGRPRAEDPR